MLMQHQKGGAIGRRVLCHFSCRQGSVVTRLACVVQPTAMIFFIPSKNDSMQSEQVLRLAVVHA